MKNITRYILHIFVSQIKILCFLTIIIIFNNQLLAQGTWTWKWGPLAGTTLSASGLGIFSPTNSPGERYAAACWTDKTGKFWRYGGDTYADLWCYDPSINQWALMNGGFTTIPPNYGVMGVPSPMNTPGVATFGHPAWIDNNGDLWLYGINFSDDLWKYTISTNMWTWMKGTGGGAVSVIYGTQGVASALNSPGQLNEIDCNWVDSNNNFWLYTHNDGILWKFDTSTNMWTWVNGIIGGSVNYGTIGNFAPANSPGVFAGSPMVGTLFTMWKDKNDDLFMIVNRVSGTATNVEIWKYSIILNQWACIRVDASASSVQTYVNQCLETSTNFPIARTEMRMRWVDDCDNVWIFGGVEYTGFNTMFNDIWRYNAISNKWTWVRGGISPGVYGTMGTPSFANNPNPVAGSQRWIDKKGFWLAGGQNQNGNPTHHLWLYSPDTVTANFTYTINCLNANFNNSSTTGCNNIKSFYWNFGDGTNIDSVNANPMHVYSSSGAFSVSLIVKNCTSNTDTIVKTLALNCGINTLVNSDTICSGDCANIQAVTSGGVLPYTYSWNNGISNTNAGPITVCPNITTNYQVITTDALGNKDTTINTIVVIPTPTLNLGNDTALCNASIILNAGGSGNNYLWNTGATTSTLSITNTGQYEVEVSNSICSVKDSINITIETLMLNLGNDSVFCADKSILLNATNTGATYLWNNGSTAPTLIANTSGQYWVQVTKSPCKISDTINISVIPYPNINLSNDTILCPNTSLTLSAGSPATNYLWNNGATTQTINVTANGLYYVNASNFQCSKFDSINVTFLNPINWEKNPNLCESLKYILNAGINNANYLWSTGETTQAIEIQQEGVYWIEVNKANCTLRDTLTLIGNLGEGVIFIPNSFTPNADGLNDDFYIKGEGVTEFNLMIFDRWGEKLFETSGFNAHWDGTYKGEIVKQDVYVWKVEYKTKCNSALTERVGHVNVIRYELMGY